ncbi:hypothetical protein GRX01_15450 [Halobaculum sp. WSA2]|uniref:Uncharacterized protein n=1 Tax=Halobaculum saliterrae TaxID=2073113 RepID=A0A6B0SUR3_9EURY|nr:hypothetical protein [Halobaculum saliterrae]MXR42728.1 hypothetical protein [Halobaculum saliterrae]
MNLADSAPVAGVVACLALLSVLAAPLVLIADAGTGLGVYYSSGPVGAAGVAFLAVLLVVVFLSGRQERRPASTVAGIALVAGVGLLALATAWAMAVDVQNLYSFPQSATWILWHRWLVVGVAALVPLSAGAFANAVV